MMEIHGNMYTCVFSVQGLIGVIDGGTQQRPGSERRGGFHASNRGASTMIGRRHVGYSAEHCTPRCRLCGEVVAVLVL